MCILFTVVLTFTHKRFGNENCIFKGVKTVPGKLLGFTFLQLFTGAFSPRVLQVAAASSTISVLLHLPRFNPANQGTPSHCDDGTTANQFRANSVQSEGNAFGNYFALSLKGCWGGTI